MMPPHICMRIVQASILFIEHWSVDRQHASISEGCNAEGALLTSKSCDRQEKDPGQRVNSERDPIESVSLSHILAVGLRRRHDHGVIDKSGKTYRYDYAIACPIPGGARSRVLLLRKWLCRRWLEEHIARAIS
jgi:hypothetical protein